MLRIVRKLFRIEQLLLFIWFRLDGYISSEDQKLLDGLLKRAERSAKKLEKLDQQT